MKKEQNTVLSFLNFPFFNEIQSIRVRSQISHNFLICIKIFKVYIIAVAKQKGQSIQVMLPINHHLILCYKIIYTSQNLHRMVLACSNIFIMGKTR